MGIALFRVAEQAKLILGDRVSSVQVLIPAVIDAYAFIAKKSWYEQTAFDTMEIDGSLINVFENIEPLYDSSRDIYYIIIPSTYLMLPHQMGVNWVSTMKDKQSWVLVNNWGMFVNIKAFLMGSRNIYQIEGNKMLFPKMNKQNNTCPLLLKLAIAYDNINPYEELNIGAGLITDIINMVVAPYMPKQEPIEKIREIIN